MGVFRSPELPEYDLPALETYSGSPSSMRWVPIDSFESGLIILLGASIGLVLGRGGESEVIPTIV